MTKIERITANIRADKKLMAGINECYSWNKEHGIECFIENAERWIKAIKDRRMLCVVKHVSASGMSRSFLYLESNKHGFSGFYSLFKCFGERMTGDCVVVNGCGMDMNFHTNYTMVHRLCALGFINKKQCEVLSQMTPTCV